MYVEAWERFSASSLLLLSQQRGLSGIEPSAFIANSKTAAAMLKACKELNKCLLKPYRCF